MPALKALPVHNKKLRLTGDQVDDCGLKQTFIKLAYSVISSLSETIYKLMGKDSEIARARWRNAQKPTHWWNAHADEAGGCGSVMRAFPFGLIFYDDPQKAKLWAVEHSKITHGHPIALAACAAMAVGISHALAGDKDTEEIISAMIEAAQEYDSITALKMEQAHAYAQQAKPLIKKYGPIISKALATKEYRTFHNKVFMEFQGWAAHDAIAATIYVFSLFPHDAASALYTGVHTPGDSDSIAAMAGALVGAYTADISLDQELINSIEDSKRLETLTLEINQLHKKSR